MLAFTSTLFLSHLLVQQTHTVHVVNLKRPKTSVTVDDTNGALPRSSRQCSMAHAMPQIAVTCTNTDLCLHLKAAFRKAASADGHQIPSLHALMSRQHSTPHHTGQRGEVPLDSSLQ